MNYIKFLVLILAVSFYGCEGQRPKSNKVIEINGVSLSENLLWEIKDAVGKELMEFEKVNYYYKKVDSTWVEEIDTIRNGFYFSKIPENKAKEIIKKYFNQCADLGNYIFMQELSFDEDWNSLYDITIVKAKDQYEVIRIMNTEGVNYDVTNDMVIEKIKQWDDLVGLRIIVAQSDRVEASIEKLPEDVEGFTQQVYELCPDVIDQGYGDMEEMIKDYKTNKYFWMWWD